MNISLEEGLMTATVGLVGVIWKQLSGRISKVEHGVKECKETVISKEVCTATQELHAERIDNLHHRLNDLKIDNVEAHKVLGEAIGDVGNTVNEIKSCVTRLSIGADCE